MHVAHLTLIAVTGAWAVVCLVFAISHDQMENDARMFALLMALLAIATR